MQREGSLRAYSSFGTVLLLCVIAPVAYSAQTVQVGSCISGLQSFSTIQLAIDTVGPNAIVDVCPGTYAEQVQIPFTTLQLVGVLSGSGATPVIVPPSGGLVANGKDIFGNPVAAQIIAFGSGRVTVSHLTVDGTGNNLAGCGGPTLEGIYFENVSGTITDNVVRNQYQTDFTDYGGCQNGLAINVESTGSSNSVTISNNSVRAYQKNGITATGAATGPGALGPRVTIENNYIVGLAATGMNWQTPGAAENGVQVGFGARGSVTNNVVNDNIWALDTSSQPGNAASGILIYASTGISVTMNEVGSAQFGIVTNTDPTYGPGDNTTIKNNKVAGTQIFDGIDLCSSSNTVETNTVYGSTQSGIHIDDSCGSGNNNTVTGNTVNEACAGILLGSGSGNTVAPNTLYNIENATLSGDVCPAAAGSSDLKGRRSQRVIRPSPYVPSRR